MSVIIKTKPPAVPVVEPIDEIIVRNDLPHGRGSKAAFSNTLVVSTNQIRRGGHADNYETEYRGKPAAAHLMMVEGYGLYLNPTSMRDFAASLEILADQIEGGR